MENKQTAVEYLMEMIRLNNKDFYGMLFDDKVFEQAKAMEKDPRYQDERLQYWSEVKTIIKNYE